MRWDIRRFDSIDSTNSYLLAEAQSGAPNGTVALARHQTQGRGRRGRVWDDKPDASLLFSVLFRPPAGTPVTHYASAVGLAVADALTAEGVAADLKWPNDVVVGSRKIAGVLAEAVWAGPTAESVVVGCGVNLNWGGGLPDRLATTAVSADELVGPIEPAPMLDQVLIHLGKWVDDLPSVPPAYRRRCCTLGEQVIVETTHRALMGRAVDVDDQGALLLQDDSGTTHTVTIGDVVRARAGS